MREHGTKTSPICLPADREASWLLLPSSVSLLSGGKNVTRKHLFWYPQGDRSGLRKPRKG